MNALGIIAFVVALLLSVMIHEAGHFLTARAFGMKATQFFVGFGPTLFSRQRGETEYGVKAIPAGGFVKIVGMTPLEEVDPADDKRAFFRQPTPQRVVVLAAGSAMHFVIAIVLAVGVAFLMPIAKPGLGIADVSACVPVSTAVGSNTAAHPRTSCAAVPGGNLVDSPALAAGLKTGDVIKAVDGKTVNTLDDEGKLLREAASPAVTLTVLRGAQTLQIPVTLTPVMRNAATGAAGTNKAYALGVDLSGSTGFVSPTASQGASQAGTYLGVNSQSVLFGTFYAIGHIGSEAGQLFSHNRAQNAANGDAQLSSVVGIAQISGDIFAAKDVPVSVQIGNFLLLVGAVNASVGILNLLPLLPFDGGHIAVTLAERWTRRKRRVAAGVPVDSVATTDAAPDTEVGRRISSFYTRGAPIMYAFSMVIIVFSLVVLFADIKNPAS